jgi:hypothetical protein
MIKEKIFATCLLICTSCATPFPFEKLNEDMTAEVVQEEFGTPAATEPDCLTYWHESQNWHTTLNPFGPFLVALFLPVYLISEDEVVRDAYVLREPVLIDFDTEGLTQWELVEPIVTGTFCIEDRFEPTMAIEPGADKWEHIPGGCGVTTADWPKNPTCTEIRALQLGN